LSLLDEIRKNFTPVQQISLDSNSEATFRKAVKMAMNGSRDEAINRLCGDLSSEKSLRDNLGFVVLDCLRTLPSSKIRNEHSEITHYTNFLDRIMKGLFDDPDKHVVQWPNKARLEKLKVAQSNQISQFPSFVNHRPVPPYLWAKLALRQKKGMYIKIVMTLFAWVCL